MKRGILLLLNPGDYNDIENYCAGVYKDKNNYINFFKSDKGGAWEDNEITVREMPDCHVLQNDLRQFDRMDYSVIIFSGHGYTNEDAHTILELSPNGDKCDAEFLQRQGRTVILDCCRKKYYPSILEKSATRDYKITEESMCFVTHEKARSMYEAEIEGSNKSAIVLYSCSLDEYSNDDSNRGGVYSSELIKIGRNWSGPGVLSVVGAHAKVSHDIKWDYYGQHPNISKPKFSNGKYYPFALNVL